MPYAEMLFRPSTTAPQGWAARNTIQFPAEPLRETVRTVAPPGYRRSFTSTPSPGFTTSAACWRVRNGRALVPGLASLPFAASTYRHTPEPVAPHLEVGGGGGAVMTDVPLLPSIVVVIAAGRTAVLTSRLTMAGVTLTKATNKSRRRTRSRAAPCDAPQREPDTARPPAAPDLRSNLRTPARAEVFMSYSMHFIRTRHLMSRPLNVHQRLPLLEMYARNSASL